MKVPYFCLLYTSNHFLYKCYNGLSDKFNFLLIFISIVNFLAAIELDEKSCAVFVQKRILFPRTSILLRTKRFRRFISILHVKHECA